MAQFNREQSPAIIQVHNDPSGFLGPWLAVLVGINFMMGILAAQSTNYFSAFGYEGLRMFALVVSCILLSLAQRVVIIQASWDWFVYHYGDWECFASIQWQSPTFQLVSRLTAFTSQLFFVYRCYLLYNRNKLILVGLRLGASSTLALFAVTAIAIPATASRSSFPFFASSLPRTLTIRALTINLATDIAITGLTLWRLGGRSGQTGIPKTESALRRLRNVTVEAAVPSAICAVINMATYLTLKNWFAMMTARFYVRSFMFTLNSQVAIRRELDASNYNSQTLSTGFVFANNRGSGINRRQGDAGKSTVIIATITEAIHPMRVSLGSIDRRSAARNAQVTGSGGPSEC